MRHGAEGIDLGGLETGERSTALLHAPCPLLHALAYKQKCHDWKIILKRSAEKF